MIKLVIFDIDGVITDGKILINSQGEEFKQIDIKDVDAIYDFKRNGFIIAAITGEATPITEYFRKRFPWDYFITGNKKKGEAVKDIARDAGVTLDETCYVGDAKYDIDALKVVDLPVCPNDAIDEVKQLSKIILTKKGGNGCILELLIMLKKVNQH